ncbi:MAG: thymidine kinase [Candidatus Woesebacteria bacterium]|nr:MAG: thymidine kinase [Candidatus Woesebacteria bacterium]
MERWGRVYLICGGMFSGKTEELARLLRREQHARRKIQVFKPSIDVRYAVNQVKSHNGISLDAISIEKDNALTIIDCLDPNTQVVGIDEVQFFDSSIATLCKLLVVRKIKVILAGLDTDFRGEPFGSMPLLMAIAEDVTKLHAICSICGEEACRTQRIIDHKPAPYDSELIQVGGSESYEARCRRHHIVPGTPPGSVYWFKC